MLGKLLRSLGLGVAGGRAIPPESLALLAAYVDEARRREPAWERIRPADVESGRAILAAAPELQAGVLLAAAADAAEEKFYADWRVSAARTALLSQLLRHGPPLAPADLERLVQLVGAAGDVLTAWWFPVAGLVGRLERAAAEGPLAPGIVAALGRWKTAEQAGAGSAERRKLRERLIFLTGKRPAEAPLLDGRAPWADAILAEARAAAVAAVLRHASSCDGARPPKRWLDDGRALLAAAGDAAPAMLARWLAAAAEAIADSDAPPSDRNGDVLKGLCWVASLVDPATVAPALRALADASFKKIPNVGAKSHKVGNACVGALGALPGTEGVARLGQLRLSVKYAVGRRLIEKALATAAGRAGMAPDDLEDLAMPTFGLGPDGTSRRALGAHVAVLAVRDGEVALAFESLDGKAYKTTPAEVRRGHARELAELKRAAKDAERMRAAQRARLEAAPLAGRSWPAERFRARWLDHPLVSDLVHRLVWNVRTSGGADVAVTWDGAAALDLDGRPVPLAPDAIVRPWHPLAEPADRVLAWRRRLAALGVTQPFKQVHREVYVVTPAEQETRTYSNRFAGHVLRQHQLAALCRERGWSYRLQGAFDSANHPTLELPRHGYRVELWLLDMHGDVPASGAGIFLHVVTDQVRFVREGETVPLAQVPPIVLSEAMRDVDLFVGVCSIGNDPTWQDQGERAAAYDRYWSDFAFGELSELAKTRRAVLAELLPKLAIADRLRLDERFLEVKGERGTYKIHVGSGNVQTEAGRYLCIVRDGAARPEPRVALPFEGDATLSLVLSKAFLLANDRKIKDESILRQLR